MIINPLMSQKDKQVSVLALNDLYAHIPTGACSSCGICCYDAVQTSFVEYLQIKDYIEGHQLMSKERLERFKHFMISDLIEVNPCSFLEGGQCLIYEVRPFVCRMFGFQSRYEQDQRRRLLMKAHKETAQYYQETYGIALPKGVIHHIIPYCEKFRPRKALSRATRNDFYDRLIGLDAPYYLKGLVSEKYMEMTLMHWILHDYADWEEVVNKRMLLVQSIEHIGIKKTK